MIFLASFSSGISPSVDEMIKVNNCLDQFPRSMIQHIDLYVEFYDEENLYTAMRIGWCESRGKATAHRTEDRDSGVMQFIPRTWRWIVEEYGIPDWDEWVIMRFGRPYLKDEVSKSDFGFSHQKAQNTAYWNIKASSHLAEDIYNKTQWRDWNSSKWCWGDPVKWNKYWKEEK